jgi:hypothetical protein
MNRLAINFGVFFWNYWVVDIINIFLVFEKSNLRNFNKHIRIHNC